MRKLYILIILSFPTFLFAGKVSAINVYANEGVKSLTILGMTLIGLFWMYKIIKRGLTGQGSRIFGDTVKYSILLAIMASSGTVLTVLVKTINAGISDKNVAMGMADTYQKFDTAFWKMINRNEEDISNLLGTNKKTEEKKENEEMEKAATWGAAGTLDRKYGTTKLGSSKSLAATVKEGFKNIATLAYTLINPLFWIASILFVLMKGLLTLCFVSKVLVMDIAWPLYYQYTLIGFVFAFSLAGIEHGVSAITSWLLSVIEVALWPFFYVFGFSIAKSSLTTSYDKLLNLVDTADFATRIAQVGADVLTVAKVIASLLFLILLPFLVGAIARSVVKNEGASRMADDFVGNVGRKFIS